MFGKEQCRNRATLNSTGMSQMHFRGREASRRGTLSKGSFLVSLTHSTWVTSLPPTCGSHPLASLSSHQSVFCLRCNLPTSSPFPGLFTSCSVCLGGVRPHPSHILVILQVSAQSSHLRGDVPDGPALITFPFMMLTTLRSHLIGLSSHLLSIDGLFH